MASMAPGSTAPSPAGWRAGETSARLGAGAAALLVHLVLGLALLWGLGAPLPRAVESTLEVFNVAPPPPPEPDPVRPPPRRESPSPNNRHSPGREGAAAPPNLRSDATQIVAPPPLVRLPLPPPVTAAPVAGAGSQAAQGAAEIRGPGPGAGGVGNGRGAGGYGDGDGGGGGYGRFTPPRHLRGRLSDRDYPAAAWEAGAGGTVSVRFTVALDGRAVNCRITRSSGTRLLDETTCRLIERRYRFDPSRDRDGRPVLSDVVEDHEWVTYDEPPDPDRRGRPD